MSDSSDSDVQQPSSVPRPPVQLTPAQRAFVNKGELYFNELRAAWTNSAVSQSTQNRLSRLISGNCYTGEGIAITSKNPSAPASSSSSSTPMDLSDPAPAPRPPVQAAAAPSRMEGLSDAEPMRASSQSVCVVTSCLSSFFLTGFLEVFSRVVRSMRKLCFIVWNRPKDFLGPSHCRKWWSSCCVCGKTTKACRWGSASAA